MSRYAASAGALVLAVSCLAVQPARAQIPTVPGRSSGVADVYAYSGLGSYDSFSFSGTLSFGSATFHGDATGSRDLNASTNSGWALRSGTDDAQYLEATCRGDDPTGLSFSLGYPEVVTLVCTGHVDNGPVRTTTLALALPTVTTYDPFHGGQYAWHYSGTYKG